MTDYAPTTDERRETAIRYIENRGLSLDDCDGLYILDDPDLPRVLLITGDDRTWETYGFDTVDAAGFYVERHCGESPLNVVVDLDVGQVYEMRLAPVGRV